MPSLLFAVYYLIVTPIGLLMRAAGRDPLCREWLPDAPTYLILPKER